MMNYMDKLSWDSLVRWHAVQDHEDLGDDPSACWVGARYVLHQPNMLDGGLGEPEYTMVIQPSDLLAIDGWAHCYVENNYEMHHFSVFVKGNALTLVQTYGGIDELFKILFDKDSWIALLTCACEGDGKMWRSVFVIPRAVRIPNDVGRATLQLK